MKKNIINKKTNYFTSLVLICILFINSTVYAYTMSVSGTNDISPSKSDFSKAESPMYDDKSQIINDEIPSKYKMNIYHYECQEGGYYQIYTTGLLDTVGKVYEEQNSLLSTSYKKRAYNDRGFITEVDNCSMVVKMDRYEDYYICIRGWNALKGDYSLHIEPNQDKTWFKNYGVWECEMMPNSAAISGIWTNRKIYINKEQAILYYWMLDPATTIECGNVDYTLKQLKTLYKGDPSKAVSIVTTALSSAVGVKYTSLGITTSVLGMFITESLSTGKSQREQMMERLVDICGVSQKANATKWSGKWSSKNGMLIKETFTGTPGMQYIYNYSKFSGTSLTGAKWYYGTWSY